MAEEDDIFIDDESEDLDDSVVAEEAQAEAVKKLRAKLKEAEAKAKEHLDSWQRAQADFVNLRKRDEEGRTEFLKFANTRLVEELIPVLDALNSAVSHGDLPAGPGRRGSDVEPIRNLFLKVLKQNGLEELDPIGEAFDPATHEAISMQETPEKDEDHKILEVFQRGYSLNGRVVRPAKVRVGEYKA
ncbi:nucleotide exchange factor GrpE [Candidatus Parcubacteria bacterium]|nr:nucleotide exchange factor GrpE [Candidatus Parcubacteria bacterium]